MSRRFRFKAEILAELLKRVGFGYEFSSDEILELASYGDPRANRAHFQQVQQWGVRGFPVLLLVRENGFAHAGQWLY